MRQRIVRLLLPWLCGLLLAAGPAGAQSEPPGGDWVYRIAPSDTLIGLSSTYLQAPYGWRDLQKLNRIADPLRLVPGSALRIPLKWLRREIGVAEVVHVQGDARVVRGAEPPRAVQAGESLRAGDVLRTGPGASLTLRFADGSRLLATPDSEFRIERLLVLGRSGLADTRLQLDRGSVDSVVTPQKGRRGGYEIRTPTVNLGVRGTEFRAHADPQQANARVEVLTGQVAATAGREVRVDAGFGSVAAAGKPPQPPRRLLPAPQLPADGVRLERIPLRLGWQAATGASGYRAQVLAEGQPERLLLDGQFSDAAARWADLPDGRYLLRVRAVDADGLEGLNASTTLVVKARPEPPFTSQPGADARVYGDAAVFAWTRPAVAVRYRLQVADDAGFTRLRADERALAEPGFQLALPPGRYHWRLASIAADGDQGPFGDAQAFTQRAIPPSPAAELPQVGDGQLVFRWQAATAGESFDVQVARDAEFTQIVRAERTAQSSIALVEPPSGRYYMRVRTVDPDGFAGPYGGTQQIEVPASRWWLLIPPAVLLLLAL